MLYIILCPSVVNIIVISDGKTLIPCSISSFFLKWEVQGGDIKYGLVVDFIILLGLPFLDILLKCDGKGVCIMTLFTDFDLSIVVVE